MLDRKEIEQFQRLAGGAEGDRTPNLRIANAALSQLSYGPGAAKSWLPRAI